MKTVGRTIEGGVLVEMTGDEINALQKLRDVLLSMGFNPEEYWTYVKFDSSFDYAGAFKCIENWSRRASD